jgi:hypothetical protein
LLDQILGKPGSSGLFCVLGLGRGRQSDCRLGGVASFLDKKD